MRNIISQLLALGPELASFILTTAILAPRPALAISPVAVPSPNLDLGPLGRVALVGDFDSISLYQYEGQSETPLNHNGSQYLLQQYPNGAFQDLGMSDAYIKTMCPFISQGNLEGVILGGNFTSISGMAAASAALWDPSTGGVTNLQGLEGSVYTVYCDADRSEVFFGGSFTANGGVNMNAMSWTTNWTALPFVGFNGPVNSITKISNGNMIFGGTFDGIGNMTGGSTGLLNSQVIPLASGNLSTAGSSTTMAGFEDPSNIICQTGQDGPGSTWLLQDGISGWWQGTYAFGYNPTKLRLYNTGYEGRGTKQWHFENLNSGGVPNLVYTDSFGQNQSCSSVCPLNPRNGTNSYQDFYFVPSVGMSEFRIWIDDYYGAGGGLAGIEMFQDDLYSFAVQEFNEPNCDAVSTGSSSTNSPADAWYRVPNNGTSSSDWLQINLDGTNANNSTNVVFQPNIQQSGNYSVLMYTPGCVPDNSCAFRSSVNVTGTMTTDSNGPAFSTVVTQNNDYDKFDQIYYGYVDVTSDSFRPEVTLSPGVAGQGSPYMLVAQRVRFDIVSSTGGLNGLYEYNPNNTTQTTTNFSESLIDKAGLSLNAGANVNALVTDGDALYVAGEFSGNGISNIMVVNPAATPLTDGGLNDAVFAMYLNGSTLYTAGNFTDTATSSSTKGLNGIAAYDTSSKTWTPLGAGVNGVVTSLVEIPINITSDGDLQQCIAVTGLFTAVNGYGDNDAYNVSGFAVWVPSANDWLSNIPAATVELQGDLVAMTTVPGYQDVYAGDVSLLTLGLGDAVELASDGVALQSFGVKVDTSNSTGSSSSSSSSSKVKRDFSASQNYTGVYTGMYFGQDNLNLTILGGQFSATASNGQMVQSLLVINNTESSQTVAGISGIDADSTIVALGTYNNILYAGGSLTGTVNGNSIAGVVAYDLVAAKPAPTQPPSLTGDSAVVVNSIAVQDDSSSIYFGGNFSHAGALPCATLCYYDAATQQWNYPGSISGTISQMNFSSSTELYIAGDLQFPASSGSTTKNKTSMAMYDSKTQTFAAVPGASDLPGPISVFSAVDPTFQEIWAAGTATNNGSAFLAYYTNSAWTLVSGLGPETSIRGLQSMSLDQNHYHANTALVPNSALLLLVGNIALPDFGNASAVLFNGTDFTPFLLTTKVSGSDPSEGSIAGIFVQYPAAFFQTSNHELALGLIVLIGLAIALGLICIVIAAGLLMERQRRRNQGYVPMSFVREKEGSPFSRLPPETLFGGIKEKGPPKV